jgi:VanZ family protein
MLTNNLLVLKKTVLGLAIGWMFLIAILCLISFGDFPSVGVQSADKYVHVTFYFILILLWGFYSMLKQNEIRLGKIVLFVTLSLFYGILIEFLQETLTTTRHADALDVLANFTGALLALIVFAFIKKQKQANRRI